MALNLGPAPALDPFDSFAVQQWMLSLQQAMSTTTFDEAAQDAIGDILVDSSRINFTYTDATPAITADLIAASVDNTFLSNMTQSTIKGRAVSAGTGDPTDLTASQTFTILAAHTAARVSLRI